MRWPLPLTCVVFGIAGAAAPLVAAPAAQCTPGDGLEFVCGAERPEDVARIPQTRWLVFSGFSDGAGLKLVDTTTRRMKTWYSGAPGQLRHEPTQFAGCATPPDVKRFNAQGMSLKTLRAGFHRLYVVNHGGRESIEVFTVDSSADEPMLSWIGCVPMPPGIAANSVAAYSDGTLLATVLTHPGKTITDFVRGGITGGVYQWRPGDAGFRLLPGTQLPGNNGIETSRDDREFYVVAFGWRSVVIYPREATATPVRRALAPGFMPDNIHWDGERLLLAGMQADEPACEGTRKIVDGKADDMRCHRGYTVAELDPQTLQFSIVAYAEPDPTFNGVSAAAIVGEELWLASYQADRVAVRPLPGAMSSRPR